MTDTARRTRARQSTVAQAASTLTISSKYMGEEESRQVALEVRRFEVEPAYVRVSAGMTKNMGNYESLRVEVSLSVPCYAEEVDAAFPVVADKVSAFLIEELNTYGEA